MFCDWFDIEKKKKKRISKEGSTNPDPFKFVFKKYISYGTWKEKQN